MSIEQVYILIALVSLCILFSIMSFCFGYIQGFKKSKEIDDKIMEEISNKRGIKYGRK